ncbi:MAG: L,D-transpeptidase family protein, partial [Alphaproteobacteria bacterium]
MRWVVGVVCCLFAVFALSTADPNSAFAKRYKDADKSSSKSGKKAKKTRPDHLFAIVSIRDQHVSFYGAKGLYAQGRVSTGRSGHRTPTGVFSILQKQRYHESNLYNSAPMPFMQRITWSGVAMHQGVVPRYPASHGCIRMRRSFAKRMYGVTKVGQRVIVAPHDIEPERIAHSNLPIPYMHIAPGEAAVVDAGEGTTHVSAPISGYAPQQALPNAFEDISLKNVAPPKLLNPKKYAWALRKKAQDDIKAAAKALKDANKAVYAKRKDASKAARATRKAEYAVSNLEDEIADLARRIQRRSASAERYQKKIDAKAKFEAGVAEAQTRLEVARHFKQVKDQALTQAWKDASAAEAAEGDATVEDQIAASKEDEARAAGKAIKSAKAALREAEYDLEKADRKAQRAAKKKARVDEDIAEAEEQRRGYEEQLRLAREALEEAHRFQAEKDQALAEAKRAVEIARAARQAARIAYKVANRRLEPVSVFISRKTSRLYVRQGFKSVFDVGVIINEPERPIGTHVLVATNAEIGAQTE